MRTFQTAHAHVRLDEFPPTAVKALVERLKKSLPEEESDAVDTFTVGYLLKSNYLQSRY